MTLGQQAGKGQPATSLVWGRTAAITVLDNIACSQKTPSTSSGAIQPFAAAQQACTVAPPSAFSSATQQRMTSSDLVEFLRAACGPALVVEEAGGRLVFRDPHVVIMLLETACSKPDRGQRFMGDLLCLLETHVFGQLEFLKQAIAHAAIFAAAGSSSGLTDAHTASTPLLRVLMEVQPLQRAVFSAMCQSIVALDNVLEPAPSERDLVDQALRLLRTVETNSCPQFLVGHLLDCLDAVSGRCKRSILESLPDLCGGRRDETVVDRVVTVMSSEAALTGSCLDALSRLGLSGSWRASLCAQVAAALEVTAYEEFPAIVRFLLANTPQPWSVLCSVRQRIQAVVDAFAAQHAWPSMSQIRREKTSRSLRIGPVDVTGESRPLIPAGTDPLTDTVVIELLADSCLRVSENAQRRFLQELCSQQQCGDPGCLWGHDLCLLLYLARAGLFQEDVVELCCRLFATGTVHWDKFVLFMTERPAIFGWLFHAFLAVAESLVLSQDLPAAIAGQKLYRFVFCRCDHQRNVLVGRLLRHACSRSQIESCCALDILLDLEPATLAPFRVGLQSLFDMVEQMALAAVGKLYALYFRQGEGSPLFDEALIILRKQLSHPLDAYRRMGIAGLASLVTLCCRYRDRCSNSVVGLAAKMLKTGLTVALADRLDMMSFFVETLVLFGSTPSFAGSEAPAAPSEKHFFPHTASVVLHPELALILLETLLPLFCDLGASPDSPDADADSPLSSASPHPGPRESRDAAGLLNCPAVQLSDEPCDFCEITASPRPSSMGHPTELHMSAPAAAGTAVLLLDWTQLCARRPSRAVAVSVASWILLMDASIESLREANDRTTLVADAVLQSSARVASFSPLLSSRQSCSLLHICGITMRLLQPRIGLSGGLALSEDAGMLFGGMASATMSVLSLAITTVPGLSSSPSSSSLSVPTDVAASSALVAAWSLAETAASALFVRILNVALSSPNGLSEAATPETVARQTKVRRHRYLELPDWSLQFFPCSEDATPACAPCAGGAALRPLDSSFTSMCQSLSLSTFLGHGSASTFDAVCRLLCHGATADGGSSRLVKARCVSFLLFLAAFNAERLFDPWFRDDAVAAGGAPAPALGELCGSATTSFLTALPNIIALLQELLLHRSAAETPRSQRVSATPASGEQRCIGNDAELQHQVLAGMSLHCFGVVLSSMTRCDASQVASCVRLLLSTDQLIDIVDVVQEAAELASPFRYLHDVRVMIENVHSFLRLCCPLLGMARCAEAEDGLCGLVRRLSVCAGHALCGSYTSACRGLRSDLEYCLQMFIDNAEDPLMLIRAFCLKVFVRFAEPADGADNAEDGCRSSRVDKKWKTLDVSSFFTYYSAIGQLLVAVLRKQCARALEASKARQVPSGAAAAGTADCDSVSSSCTAGGHRNQDNRHPQDSRDSANTDTSGVVGLIVRTLPASAEMVGLLLALATLCKTGRFAGHGQVLRRCVRICVPFLNTLRPFLRLVAQALLAHADVRSAARAACTSDFFKHIHECRKILLAIVGDKKYSTADPGSAAAVKKCLDLLFSAEQELLSLFGAAAEPVGAASRSDAEGRRLDGVGASRGGGRLSGILKTRNLEGQLLSSQFADEPSADPSASEPGSDAKRRRTAR